MKNGTMSKLSNFTQKTTLLGDTSGWRIVALIIGGLTVLIWLAMFIGGVRGFDLSDNGFYLLSMSQYENITIDVFLFGGLLKYPYQLFGESVVALRIFGMVVTLFVTGALAFMSVSLFQPIVNRSQRWLLILPALSAGVFIYRSWSTTPSYNWLVVTGLVVACIGLLLWLTSEHKIHARWGAFILGIGIMLVAWGKLTSLALLLAGLLLVLPVTAYSFRTHQRLRPSWWLWVLLGASLVFVLGLRQDVSLSHIVNKLSQGYHHQALVRANTDAFITTFIEIPLQSTSNLVATALSAIAPISIVILLAGLLLRKIRPNIMIVSRFLSVIYSLGLMLITFNLKSYRDIGWWAVALYFMTVLFVWIARYTTQNNEHSQDEQTAILNQYLRFYSVMLMLLPIVAMFGTRNYVVGVGRTGYFVVLATILWIIQIPSSTHPRMQHLQRIMLVGITLSVAWVMFTTAQNPYRQDVPVWTMQTPVTIRQGQDSVLVSEKLAIYLRDIQTVAEEAGFVAGTPIIDWTGHAPGTVYALGGEAYGFMWFLGNYAGSDEAARFILEEGWTESQRQSAWLLTSDNRANRALSDDVLRDSGH
jgi:hypothetical protein